MELIEPRRLKRSRNDRMLAGVCGGLAKYWDLDPTIVRLGFALGTLFTAILPGISIYLIMWIVMPKESEILPM